MDSEDWISGREQLGNALQSLVEAGHELGIAAEEVALWRTVAGSLNDSLMVLLTGEEGCGKSSLVGALAQEGHLSADDFSHEDSYDLIVWKHGPRPLNVPDAGLLENYRPANILKHIEFIEVAPRHPDGARDAMQRAYMMSDMVFMVFSAADPWGEAQWEHLAEMHPLRKQPVAVVLTHTEQRTGEELQAIIDHLCKRSEKITGHQAAGFLLTTGSLLDALKGRAEEALPPGANSIGDLRQWISGTVSQQTGTMALKNRVHTLIQGAAKRITEGLEQADSNSGVEFDCMRSIEDELNRGMDQAMATLEQERSKVMEAYRDEMLKVGERLARQVGLPGIAGSLFKGGGWIGVELERVAGMIAVEVEAGLSRSISKVEECLATCLRRISEQVASVFDGEVIDHGEKSERTREGAEHSNVLCRRIHLRVHEALEDREEVGAIRAMIGWRRMVLWVMLLGLAAGVQRVWSLNLWSSYTEGFNLVVVPGALLVVLLWLLVYLRIKKRRILSLYDRVLNIARSQIERRIEEIQEIQMELCRQDLPGTLDVLKAKAGQSADDLHRCRENVAQAMSLARQL